MEPNRTRPESYLPGKSVPYMVPFGEGERVETFGLLFTEKARAVETAGEFGLLEITGIRDRGAAPHSHGIEAESFYVLEGTIRVWAGDIEHVIHPGDFVYIPKTVPHMFRIESATAKWLAIITPGGFEHFFVELGKSTQDYTAPRPSDDVFLPSTAFRAEVARRYDNRPEDEWDPTKGAWRPMRTAD